MPAAFSGEEGGGFNEFPPVGRSERAPITFVAVVVAGFRDGIPVRPFVRFWMLRAGTLHSSERMLLSRDVLVVPVPYLRGETCIGESSLRLGVDFIERTELCVSAGMLLGFVGDGVRGDFSMRA